MFASKDTLLTRPSGYSIARSVRTRSSATAYFSRTPTSNGNRQIFTWSGWVKRGTLGSRVALFNSGDTGSGVLDGIQIIFFGDNTIQASATGGTTINISTNAVYRDPSAWYHIVFAVDTTQATSSNRVKIYVNGSQVTSFSTATYPSQNQNFDINNTAYPMKIGASVDTATTVYYYDGYMTEINYVDGQALTPSSFGETDSITGVWKPKAYSGTYGTNGFELNFSDNSNNTAATIGKDYSGNGNNWTPNNISVTAGVTYDSMVDSPTVGSLSSNYCVLNPLAKAFSNGGTGTTSNGNLTIAFGATNWYGHKGSIAVSSGKWYYEVVNTSGTNSVQAGFTLVTVESETATGVYRYRSNGNKVSTGYTAYGAAWNSAGDIAGVAFDADTGEITFYKNGVSQGSAFTSIPAGLYAPEVIVETATTANVNFGQRPFSYTPPTGYVALNTYNLPASTIKNGAAYMAASLWTGNGTARSISNAVGSTSFQPDLVWVKSRTQAIAHRLIDSIRGAGNTLASNLTNAEFSDPQGVTSFNSGGFGVGTDTSYNQSSDTYVGWQWKAGGTAVSNTAGSITSSVSANTTAGFSVVTYTGNGTAGATVGHGLGVAPQFIIAKSRSISASNWLLYHVSLTGTQYLTFTTAAATTNNGAWYNTTPTSSVFTIGGFGDINTSASTYVAYCFSAVAGYSAFGSYTGNGSSDGTFVYTGFRPRWVMIKASSGSGSPSTQSWYVLDSSRDTYNLTGYKLFPNSSNAENSGQTFDNNSLDFLSNGFKLRTSNDGTNNSLNTYIYAAFAENPFKNSLAR